MAGLRILNVLLTSTVCTCAFSPVAAGALSFQAAKKQTTTTKPKNSAMAVQAVVLDDEIKAALKSAPDASQWPNKDYARLLDLGESTVKPDGTVVSEYRMATKLFNERARSRADVALSFNSTYQTIRLDFARTIKKNGTVVAVRPEDVHSSARFSDYPLYDDSKALRFSMPGIEDGCVIDYKFTLTTRPLLMPGQIWNHWRFSDEGPVSLSRYVLRIPETKAIHFRVLNDDSVKPTITTSSKTHTKVYEWQLSHIKPIEIEPAMPELKEVQVWLELSTLDSWPDVAHWYWGLQSSQSVAADPIRKTVKEVIAGKATDEAKTRALYDWITEHVRYVAVELGLSAYKPHAAGEVFQKLYGDCKDKANLLITMLGEAGIKAHPALLSASDPFPIHTLLASPAQFDHCIVLAEVGGKDVWLDPTAETCAYGDIPEGDRGADALVIRGGEGRFQVVPKYKPEENGYDYKSVTKLKPDGSAEMETETSMRGTSAQQYRAYVRQLTPEKRTEMLKSWGQSLAPGGTLKGSDLPDPRAKEGPYVIKVSVSAPGLAKQSGSLLLLPVTGASQAGERANPFLKETRVWPIDWQQSTLRRFENKVILPEGYSADSLPADVEIDEPFMMYKRQIVKSPDGKTLTIFWTSAVRTGRQPASEIGKLRATYDKLNRVLDDIIVLKKAG